MAKLPWMKFFPSNYLADTRALSPAAKGIWMDMICYLWQAEKRGEFTYPIDDLARMLGASSDALEEALTAFRLHKIAEIKKDSHGNVTVMSRRIVREEKTRENNRLRKEKERSHADVTEMSRVTEGPCHANVTPQRIEDRSQRIEDRKELKASLIGRADPEPDNGNCAFLDKLQEAEKHKKTFDQIDRLRIVLSANGTFKRASSWAQMKIQLQYHPEAILLALQRVQQYKPDNPEAYADQVILVESQNKNEADHVSRSKSLKESAPKSIGELLNGAIKSENNHA